MLPGMFLLMKYQLTFWGGKIGRTAFVFLFIFFTIILRLCFVNRMGLTLHQHAHGHGHSHSSGEHSHGDSHSVENAIDSSDSTSKVKHKNNVNVRAAFIHVLGDLLQSVGVLIASFIIFYKVSYQVC